MRHTLLRATMGSTAYGLAREGSDIDTLGIFAYDTNDFWTLDQLNETETSPAGVKPDYTLHEVGKYLRLALKCNPSLLELLWVPMDLVQTWNVWGESLRDMRSAFLSEPYVRAAYGGYALQQVERLQRRTAEGKEGFSSDTQKRTAKHARHCFRLLRQGRELLETGNLTVRVANPEDYWSFDDATVDQIVECFGAEDAEFQAVKSELPDTPNRRRVEQYLYDLRRDYARI